MLNPWAQRWDISSCFGNKLASTYLMTYAADTLQCWQYYLRACPDPASESTSKIHSSLNFVSAFTHSWWKPQFCRVLQHWITISYSQGFLRLCSSNYVHSGWPRSKNTYSALTIVIPLLLVKMNVLNNNREVKRRRTNYVESLYKTCCPVRSHF